MISLRRYLCNIISVSEIFTVLQRRLHTRYKLTWGPAESDESWRRRRARLSRRWSCFARLHPDNRRLSDGTKAPAPSYRVSRPSCLWLPLSPFTLCKGLPPAAVNTSPFFHSASFSMASMSLVQLVDNLASEKEKQIFACRFAAITCNVICYINKIIKTN